MPWITQGKCFWLKSKDDIVQHALSSNHGEIKDGPISWSASTEGLVNSIIRSCGLRKIHESLWSVGIMVSILTTLFVCDYRNKVLAVAFGFRRFLNILSSPIMVATSDVPSFFREG